MRKHFVITLTAVLMVCLLTSCGSENKAWIESAEKATIYDLSLNRDLTWGMTSDEVKEIEKGPYDNDYETYLSVWKTAALPVDGKWKGDSSGVNNDAFKESDLVEYFVFSEDMILFEYGFQYFDTNLHQYDFLKEYYTKKFGKPEKEEYIWNDTSYEPTGKENLHSKFADGEVKVLTVWDLDKYGTILVIDWLNDPDKSDNNYGQISFIEKTGDLNTEEQRSDE